MTKIAIIDYKVRNIRSILSVFHESMNKHRSPHIWKHDDDEWKSRHSVADDGCDDK
jgi:hypothetical protein